MESLILFTASAISGMLLVYLLLGNIAKDVSIFLRKSTYKTFLPLIILIPVLITLLPGGNNILTIIALSLLVTIAPTYVLVSGYVGLITNNERVSLLHARYNVFLFIPIFLLCLVLLTISVVISNSFTMAIITVIYLTAIPSLIHKGFMDLIHLFLFEA